MRKLPNGQKLALEKSKLEDAFFSKQDAKLIEQLKALEKMKLDKEALRNVSGIESDEVLDGLIAVGMRPETMVSLEQVPLIEIAWADGSIDEKEREAMLEAAVDAGFEKGSVNYTVIEGWMKRRPPKQLLEAWTEYARALCENLTDEEKRCFREKVINRAVRIAAASGGYLGLGNKISKAEQQVIDALNAVFEK